MTTRKAIKIQIYKSTQYGEIEIGFISENQIFAVTGITQKPCGYVGEERRIIRTTQHGEQDLGYFTPTGEIFSNGLFEGGAIGWLDDDGVVVQAGLILGEEEVGRVVAATEENEQPTQEQLIAGAAALLLHFLPADAEEEKRMARR